MTTISSTFSDHISNARAAGHYFQDATISPSGWLESDCGLTLRNPISPSNQTQIAMLPEEVHLNINWSSQVDERGIIPRLLSFMPTIDTIQTLHVHNQRFSFLQEWLDVAADGEHLLRVDAEGMAAHGLVLALQQPAFPRLAALSLASVSFTHQVDERPAGPEFYHHMRMRASPLYPDDTPEIPEEEPIPEDSMTFIEILLGALAARATSGNPIIQLPIDRCNISVDMVASLRACLGEEAVDWDGQVNGGPDPNLRHVWRFW
ncbi:hypothetical protein BV25DRAFT_1825155 [Artomyces pyxidatus]|uniref:Uncharacterized protein n=1 Tax=Artomyces pyxidatus TaxID=48021 RepID=A0ACB8T351_9AGAM|nr:hypothetical protein BV25DRAFT_1825155 [Artomyces pyxidatus]